MQLDFTAVADLPMYAHDNGEGPRLYVLSAGVVYVYPWGQWDSPLGHDGTGVYDYATLVEWATTGVVGDDK